MIKLLEVCLVPSNGRNIDSRAGGDILTTNTQKVKEEKRDGGRRGWNREGQRLKYIHKNYS